MRVLKIRVRAILKQRPDITVMKMMKTLRREYPIRDSRACELMRSCRQEVFGRNRMQKRIGWQVDCRTAARLRIAAIWRRHPDFTVRQIAKQVRNELRPKHLKVLDYMLEHGEQDTALRAIRRFGRQINVIQGKRPRR